MDFYEELKALVKNELGYLPSGEALDRMLKDGERMVYAKGETIIEAGHRHTDIFFIHSGIVRFTDIDQGKERTYAFALPGTIFMSKHSFVMNMPSYYNVSACCPSEIVKISRTNFWKAMENNHELSLFMLKYAHGELFAGEYRNAMIHNGNASERFNSMLKDRPAIIENVSQKIIASYLGVTPEYFSKLKRLHFKNQS